jgi:AAA domain
LVTARGHEFVTRKEGSTGSAKRKSLDDVSLHAPSAQAVLDILAAVPCNDTTFETRDAFVAALAAIKGALGPARDEHWPVVLDWALQYPGAEDDYIEKIWSSIKDAAVGWNWLMTWARSHNYTGLAELYFDDEPSAALAGETLRPSGSKTIKANPFTWKDPKTIPPREWLYGRHYVRKNLGTTIAPGGVGKSALVIVEALAMVTRKNLLKDGELPAAPLRVWYINLEDPPDELQRRVTAACLHHKILPEEIEGRLFITSGRDTEIVIARDDRGGLKLAEPVIDALRQEIQDKQIDVLIIDPFVASHGVSENDNVKINAVLGQWRMLADVTRCAIELVHHTRKPAFGQGEYSVDDARGAGAMIAAVRSARTLNPMTKDEAVKAGLAEDQRRLFFRVDNGKANLAPPAERSTWRRHISVQLGNGESVAHAGDSVGVVDTWEWPDPTEDVTPDDVRAVQEAVAAGVWRENPQANDWVGNAIADVLALDVDEPSVRAKVKQLQRSWVNDGVLKIVERKNAKREIKRYVEVGKKKKVTA